LATFNPNLSPLPLGGEDEGEGEEGELTLRIDLIDFPYLLKLRPSFKISQKYISKIKLKINALKNLS
jgi:hypothetical protein